ncbi:MAG: hypothetical protein ACM30G_15065, partial [Micromonosporaceae bacterium]
MGRHQQPTPDKTAAAPFAAVLRLPRGRTAASLALLATAVLMLAAVAMAPAMGYAPAADGTTTEATLTFLRGQRDACQVMLDSATTSAQRTRARTCINDVERAIAALLSTPTTAPSSTPTGSPTPGPTATTPSPSPTTPAPSPTTPAPSATPSPTAVPTPSPTPTGWPGPDNTGVPAGTVLTAYTGPCTITTPGTVIDAKLIGCDLTVAAAGVTITRSQVNGVVEVSSGGTGTTVQLAISDSYINAGRRQVTGLGDRLFIATRVEVTGGNRGVLCAWRCTLQDSWVHGTYVEAAWHASGVRAERYSTIIHNTIACDWLMPTPQDGGCSADLTGYPDFAPPHDWIIQDNFFVANPNGAAFCSYGGSTGGKPYSSDPLTGTSIQFIGNT